MLLDLFLVRFRPNFLFVPRVVDEVGYTYIGLSFYCTLNT